MRKPIRYPWQSNDEYILVCAFAHYLQLASKPKRKKKKLK